MVTKEKLKVRLGLLQIVGDGFMRFAEADGFFFSGEGISIRKSRKMWDLFTLLVPALQFLFSLVLIPNVLIFLREGSRKMT